MTRDAGGGPRGVARGSWLSEASAALLLALCVFGCYWNGLHGQLVFDDVSAVVNNPDVLAGAPWAPASWLAYMSHNFWGDDMASPSARHYSYRPLVVASFAANHAVHGLDVMGYHLVNVVLHLAVTVGVERVARVLAAFAAAPDGSFARIAISGRGVGPSVASVCAGVLFATLPVHVEAVTGVVGRAELMGAVCFLAALWTYLGALVHDASCDADAADAALPFDGKRRSSLLTMAWIKSKECTGFVLRAVLWGAAGVLCKEQAVTVLGVCMVMELTLGLNVVHRWAQGQRMSLDWVRPRRVVTLLCGTVVILFLRFAVMRGETAEFDWQTNPSAHEPFVPRVLTRAWYNTVHFYLMVWPEPLCADWSGASIPIVRSVTDSRIAGILLCGGVLAGLLWVATRAAASNDGHRQRRGAALLVSLAAMLFPFIPASGWIIGVGFVVADRVMYMPSIGYCLLVAVLLTLVSPASGKSATRTKSVVKVLLVAGITLLCAAYALRCMVRNEDWADEVSLYKSILRDLPNNAKAHHNYAATVQASATNLDEREHHFKEAIRLFPDYLAAYNNLGTLYAKSRRPQLAKVAFEQGIEASQRVSIVQGAMGSLRRNLQTLLRNHPQLGG